MCYSVQSSLKTTLISLFAIIFLLSSKIPHFQWIGFGLISWCGMQFAELLLWLTEPRKGCTMWNKIITMTLIPAVLIMQPLGFLWGSLYVTPWNKLSETHQNMMILYSLFIIGCVIFLFYYKPEKICTTVTESGHLYWFTSKYLYGPIELIKYMLWAFFILLPIFLLWRKNFMVILLLILTPTFGFITGFKSDSRGSIWCHYTSYTSIIGIILLFAQQFLGLKIVN